jgi:hypothetical protein
MSIFSMELSDCSLQTERLLSIWPVTQARPHACSALFFGKGSVTNMEYVGLVLDLLDGGMNYEALMGLALQVKLGGTPSHAAVVDLLYTNLVGTAPAQPELDSFVGLLDAGNYTPASLGVLVAGSSLNATNINLIVLSQIGLAYITI